MGHKECVIIIKIIGDTAKDWSPPYPDTEYQKMKCDECGEEVMVPKETIKAYKKELKNKKVKVVCHNHSILVGIGLV
jgi:DNA-directed RNA polymerase subunit M/transcription elongation factor TFIIS